MTDGEMAMKKRVSAEQIVAILKQAELACLLLI